MSESRIEFTELVRDRDLVLSRTDWVAVMEATGEADSCFSSEYSWDQWSTYRQALRDLTEGYTKGTPIDPETIPWPTLPAEPAARYKDNPIDRGQLDVQEGLVDS